MNATIEFPPSIRIFASSYQNGSSAEAGFVKDAIAQFKDEFHKSIALNINSCKRSEVLTEIYNEARLSNWDAYGAQPVSFETYCQSERFIKLLPNDLPLPDVSAHPDGEIVFEWRIPSGKILSVSIGDGNFVTYAGLFGSTERYGVEDFIDEIPTEIRTMFGKLFAE
jgi:hypothetical protein